MSFKFRELEYRDIPLAMLSDNPVYPEGRLVDEELEDLKDTIVESGVCMPLMVAAVGARYVILDGHRRLRAVRAMGWTTAPCYVVNLEPHEDVSVFFALLHMGDMPRWPWSEVDKDDDEDTDEGVS